MKSFTWKNYHDYSKKLIVLNTLTVKDLDCFTSYYSWLEGMSSVKELYDGLKEDGFTILQAVKIINDIEKSVKMIEDAPVNIIQCVKEFITEDCQDTDRLQQLTGCRKETAYAFSIYLYVTLHKPPNLFLNHNKVAC